MWRGPAKLHTFLSLWHAIQSSPKKSYQIRFGKDFSKVWEKYRNKMNRGECYLDAVEHSSSERKPKWNKTSVWKHHSFWKFSTRLQFAVISKTKMSIEVSFSLWICSSKHWFNLRLPRNLTSWQIEVQFQASETRSFQYCPVHDGTGRKFMRRSYVCGEHKQRFIVSSECH